jgi:circadian clock protein KaiC
LLNHLKLPLVVKPESTSEILEIISKEVAKAPPQVVVVDSITPLLKAVERDLEARAILQNFFAELPRLINGLVALIVEISSGWEAVDLGDLGFVADVIVSLKHRVEGGLLSRYVEIVKARGASLSVVELPFSIVEGRGIVVFEPIVIEEIPAMGAESIASPCSVLNDLIGPVRRGEVIYITYPPDARPVPILVHILAMALENNARVLFISYKVSPEDIKMHTESWLVKLGVDRENARRLLNKYLINKEYKSNKCFAISTRPLGAKDRQ